MLEVLISPRKARQSPWLMFLVGFLYAIISFLLVKIIFSQDPVLSKSSGILIVLFSALFSVIFVYFAIRMEEKESLVKKTETASLLSDWKIVYMFALLFLGFLAGFVASQMVFPNTLDFNSQIQTYCIISSPNQYDSCLDQYRIGEVVNNLTATTNIGGNFYSIFTNNVSVSLLILLFTLIFGAGVIFILVWNASIIASAIVLVTKYQLSAIPAGLLRFLVHGVPEIIAYFLFALAGGMLSISLRSFIGKTLDRDILLTTLKRAIYLLLIGALVLIVSALIEVFITPRFFG
jgi:uncharacterized membrane protein SpoIIM required for sporulation